MTYRTRTEKHFERLRRLLLKQGYDKTHAALQSLSRLRKSLREHGCSFQPLEETLENTGADNV